MPTREELVQVFQDTQRRIAEDPRLAEATRQTQAGTQLYLRHFSAVAPAVKRETPDIAVAEDTTFHCAQGLAGQYRRVAALNFANACSPGGGVVRGAMAQEECLCRSSNLYNALTLPYLLENYYNHNSKATGDMGTDALIFSPGVTVFKTDDAVPQPMEDWFRVDVLTSAAPYYDATKKHPVTLEKLETVCKGRIRNVLEVAVANDADALVLGAFGCGVFNNPPRLVASVFRRLLVDEGYGRYFRRVVFAIKPNDRSNSNLAAFREVFGS